VKLSNVDFQNFSKKNKKNGGLKTWMKVFNITFIPEFRILRLSKVTFYGKG
jgi:hypothetical protein